MEQHDPDRTQFIPQATQQLPYPDYYQPHYRPPVWARGQQPQRTRATRRILGAVVAVLALAGVSTAIALGTSGPTGAAPAAFQPPSTTTAATSGVKGTTPSASADPRPAVPVTTAASQPIPVPPVVDSSDNPAPATSTAPAPHTAANPGPEPDPYPVSEPNPNPNPGPGPGPGPGPITEQRNNILAAAMAWMDARNAGDGQRVLQLGCLDDVDAVNGGQQNPAAFAGSSSIRPTGKVAPFGSNNLVAYVEISQIDLHNGRTIVNSTPVIWENGSWHVCYYPGARAQAVAAQS